MSTSSSLQLFSNQQAEAAPMIDGTAQGPQVGATAQGPQVGAGADSPTQGSLPAGSPYGSLAGAIQTPQAAHQHHVEQPLPTRPHVGAAQTAAGQTAVARPIIGVSVNGFKSRIVRQNQAAVMNFDSSMDHYTLSGSDSPTDPSIWQVAHAQLVQRVSSKRNFASMVLVSTLEPITPTHS